MKVYSNTDASPELKPILESIGEGLISLWDARLAALPDEEDLVAIYSYDQHLLSMMPREEFIRYNRGEASTDQVM